MLKCLFVWYLSLYFIKKKDITYNNSIVKRIAISVISIMYSTYCARSFGFEFTSYPLLQSAYLPVIQMNALVLNTVLMRKQFMNIYSYQYGT